MTELIEVLLSIALPAFALVGFALVLARIEDRESGRIKTAAPRRRNRLMLTPDPDGHLGRSGVE